MDKEKSNSKKVKNVSEKSSKSKKVVREETSSAEDKKVSKTIVAGNKVAKKSKVMSNDNSKSCDKGKKEKINLNKKIGVIKCKITKNTTPSTSHKCAKKRWILIDAKNAIAGRLGAYIVHHLRGKHLCTYTPQTDDGDKVVVINCDKVRFTGNKENNKLYRDHSQYVGNVRVRTVREVREGKRPCDLLRTTVERMIGRCRMSYKAVSKNLYLYAGEKHNNEAQNPIFVDFASLNNKNVVR